MQTTPVVDLFFRAAVMKEAKRYVRTIFASAQRNGVVMHDKPHKMLLGTVAMLIAVNEHCPLSMAKLAKMHDSEAAIRINELLENISSAGYLKEGYVPVFAKDPPCAT